MNVQPFLFGDEWIEVKDGNLTALDLFSRHYTNRFVERSRPKLIVGPGFKLLLLTRDAAALCAWRQERYRADGQEGVECCIFRRESGDLASSLLRAAMERAFARWPEQSRLFTFVDPRAVDPTFRAGRPTWGHCFYQAGWKFVRVTAKGLHLLEHLRPEGEGGSDG